MKRFTSYSMIICLITIMSSCNPKGENMRGGIMAIDVTTPHVDSIVLHKSYPGYLASEITVDLVARVNGTLQRINYKPGDIVQKGQLLFVIEPTIYKDAVTQAEAQLATAKSQYAYAKSNYESMKEASVSNAVSLIDLEQAQASMAQAKAAIDNSGAVLSTARTNLSYCYIKSPITGMITKSSVDVGNYLNGAASPQSLAKVFDNKNIYAYFSIEDVQYMKMVATQGASQKGINYEAIPISFAQPLKYTYTGNLDYLSPNIDLSTGSLKIRAKIKNEHNELRDGMYVTVNMPYEKVKNAILINDASIGTDQLGKYVYLINDSNKVIYTPIKVGELYHDTLRVVNNGLKPTDRYVTKALLKVRDGITVKPVMTK